MFLFDDTGGLIVDTEIIKQEIKQKEKEALDKLLEEGYKTSVKESLTLTKEFESADLEGWDNN